ncbi:TonB-dependent receptor, partial [Myxococcus sp. 1LA]
MHSTVFGEPRRGAAEAVAGRRALRAGLPLSIMLCVLAFAVPSSASAQEVAEAEAPTKVKRRRRVVKPAASSRPATNKTAKKPRKAVKPPPVEDTGADDTAEPEIPVLGGGPSTDEPSSASPPAPVPTPAASAPPAAAPLT